MCRPTKKHTGKDELLEPTAPENKDGVVDDDGAALELRPQSQLQAAEPVPSQHGAVDPNRQLPNHGPKLHIWSHCRPFDRDHSGETPVPSLHQRNLKAFSITADTDVVRARHRKTYVVVRSSLKHLGSMTM
jgi:hypothetical protein